MTTSERRENINQLVEHLRLIAPMARAKLASRGASPAAWDVVREAEAIVSGRTYRICKDDKCKRYEIPSLDAPNAVERMRIMVRVLTRRAA